MKKSSKATGDPVRTIPAGLTAYSENEYRRLIDLSSLPAALIDSGLNFEYANAPVCAFLACEPEDLSAIKITKFIRAKEPRPSADLTNRLSEGQMNCGEWEFFRKDGTAVWGEVLSTPLPDRRFLIFINDTTGRKRAELALLESERHHLQGQKIEALGRLAGGVAHDFNNFLAVILLHIDMLNLQLPADSPVRHRVREIKEVSNTAAGIVRQLLAFGRKQPMTPAPVVLNQMIEKLSDKLRGAVGADIELTLSLEPDMGVCFVDQVPIAQVLLNLAVNAKDAMPSGGKLRIETSNVVFEKGASHKSQAGGSYVQISVIDDGIGMDAKTLEHIFEPFFSTKGSDKGAGLGLAMVYGLVKQSGGFVWVESEIDRGTIFKIQFPRIDVKEPEATADKADSTVIAGTANETILLVDDEDAVRGLAAEILRTAGYEVLEADSGSQAVEAARTYTKPIHLLMTDFLMPQMNGREVAERLKEIHPELAVLFMSGNIGEAMSEVGGSAERFYYLGKPFSPTELEIRVREIFDSP